MIQSAIIMARGIVVPLFMVVIFGAFGLQAQVLVNPNGSFEETNVGASTSDEIVGWELDNGGNPDRVTWSVVDAPTQDGDRAFQLTVTANPDNLGENPWNIQVVNGSAPDWIVVEPGESYVFRLWLRANNAGATAGISVGNQSFAEYMRIGPGDEGARTVMLFDEWQEFVDTFTVTDTQTEIRAPLHFNFSDNLGNTIQIDNLQIYKVGDDDPVSVGDDPAVVQNYNLYQNYPNPFNPATRIPFEISERTHVTIEVFNLLGQKVATIVNSEISAGSHSLVFDASSLTSGVYLYRMQAGDHVETRQMMLLK